MNFFYASNIILALLLKEKLKAIAKAILCGEYMAGDTIFVDVKAENLGSSVLVMLNISLFPLQPMPRGECDR